MEAPLYRDPMFDGAADPVVVFHRERGEWWMFYTARRASDAGPGFAWVHGSDIGVAVSTDGAAWQTVLRGVEFTEAEGAAGYDEPAVLKLDGVNARRVRFENIVPRSDNGKVGLSEVIFHQTQ